MNTQKLVGMILLGGAGYGIYSALKGTNEKVKEIVPQNTAIETFPVTVIDNETQKPDETGVSIFDIKPAMPYESTLDSFYKRHGSYKNVDWRLLKAIAIVESGENHNAISPLNSNGTRDYGLMQLSFPQNLPAIPDWPPTDVERLTNDIDYNVHIASWLLQWNIENTSSIPEAVAAYNAGISRVRSRPKQYWPTSTQAYVDKVMREYAALKQSDLVTA